MLKINMEYRKGILFVRLTGKLNEETSKRLAEYLMSIINKYGIKYLVYNLNNLYSVDKYGLKVLNNGYNAVLKNSGNAFICDVPLIIKKNLKLNIKEIANELIAIKKFNI